MADRFYVELLKNGTWYKTKWTNPDDKNTGKHRPKPVDRVTANKCLAAARKAYPNSNYRVAKAEAH